MLDDAARKVLTIMYNSKRNEPAPIDVNYLSRLSQRSVNQVKDSVNLLVKEGFVLWDKAGNTFRVLYNSEAAKQGFRRWS